MTSFVRRRTKLRCIEVRSSKASSPAFFALAVAFGWREARMGASKSARAASALLEYRTRRERHVLRLK